MNLYVVTRGEYSDYHIETIFLDKTKAEKYIEVQKDEDYSIEEWETHDEFFQTQMETFKEYFLIEAWQERILTKEGILGNPKFSLWCDERNSITDRYSKNLYHYDEKQGRELIKLYFRLPESIDVNDPTIVEKYKKIVFDKLAHITSLIVNEDWTIEMVNKWLNH